jgi:hypothetical protein
MLIFRAMSQAEHQWWGVYAHMKAQDFVAEMRPTDAPDLIGSDTQMCVTKQGAYRADFGGRPVLERTFLIEEGIHECLLYDQPARLFIWFRLDQQIPSARGLVCLLSDEEGLRDAQAKFESRPATI